MTSSDEDDGDGQSQSSGRRSSRSGASGTSEGTLDGSGVIVELTEDMCGAIHIFKDRKLVCMTAGKCRRSGHSDMNCAPVGYYFPLTKARGKTLSGDWSQSMPPEDYAARLGAERDARREAQAALAAQMRQGVTTSQSKNAPSGRKHRGASSEADTEDDAKASSRRSSRRKNRASSPTRSIGKAAPGRSPGNSTTLALTSGDALDDASKYSNMATEMEALKKKLARRKSTAGSPPHSSDKSPSSSSSGTRKRKKKKKKSKKQSRKEQKKKKHKSKSRRRKKRRGKGYDSSDSSSSSSSSSSSADSLVDPPSPPPRKAAKPSWYALVFGKDGRSGVFENEAQAESFRIAHSLIRKFSVEEEAWEWVRKALLQHTSSPTGPDLPPPVVPGPAMPPIRLAGKDPSMGESNELFDQSLKVGAKELQTKLSPPGVDEKMAKNLGHTLIDVVALPGKHSQTETDEIGTDIARTLDEIAGRNDDDNEDNRVDTKWRNASRNRLSTVKTAADLLEHHKDVLDISDEVIQKVMVTQETILLKTEWPTEILEAWCFGGYLTTISRRSTSLYLSLLNHLLRMHTATSWELTKKEIDYYVKKFQTFRDHASSRLHCLCRIYTFLRDCCDESWRVAELDQFKLEGLYSKMEQISVASSVTGTEEGKSGKVCPKCRTGLHGLSPCPLKGFSQEEAKKRGRAIVARLLLGEDLMNVEVGEKKK